MSDTTYVDYVAPAVSAEWLNEINDHVWHDTPVIGSTIHNASAIKNTPNGTIEATNVQAAINEIVSDLSNDSGSSLIGFIQSGTGAVARTNQDKLRETVSVKDFGAVGDGVTDDTAAIQASVNSATTVYFPPGIYKATTAITLVANTILIGGGWGRSVLEFWDCDGLMMLAGTNRLQIEKIGIVARDVVGSYDPKTHKGIWSAGTAVNNNAWLVVRDTYIRGWHTCINMAYTWNSSIDNIDTSFCTYGIVLFGKSVNNSIVNSRIGANTGVASIYLQADGSTRGEGLMIANSLLASGAYGITTNNSFLSLNVTNCVIDLISDTALNLVDGKSSSISGCWIYASNYGVKLSPLSVPIELKLALANNTITTTSAAGQGVYVGANNYGVSISGGNITCEASGYCVYSDGNAVNVANIYLTKPGGQPSIYFASSDSSATNCTGNTTINQPNTFTPIIIGDVVAGVGVYTAQLGFYYRVNNLVFFDLRVAWTAHTGSANIKVAGLPYPCKNVSSYVPKVTIYTIGLTYSNQLVALINTGANTIELREMSSGGTATPVAMDTSGEIRISGFYEID